MDVEFMLTDSLEVSVIIYIYPHKVQCLYLGGSAEAFYVQDLRRSCNCSGRDVQCRFPKRWE